MGRLQELDRCRSCGEPLDRSSLQCRVCGEDNAADTEPSPHDEYEAPGYLDQLGFWSEIKHEILQQYAHAYTTILRRQDFVRRLVYIDAFAGAGVAIDRGSGDLVAGSPYRLLFDVEPAFDEYHFIELNLPKANHLRDLLGSDPRVTVHVGDANKILVRDLLPRCRFEDYARGLCLLDPYGLSVDWNVLSKIGASKSVEIFFNFMVVGANRNVLWSDISRVPETRRALLTRAWGDESWMNVAYRKTRDLFGERTEKIIGNEALISAYRDRLRNIAGFRYVPEPIPMKNSQNATVYYLFFASPNSVGNKIVEQIFNKYR
jgi:three-Cys-motif partner protein